MMRGAQRRRCIEEGRSAKDLDAARVDAVTKWMTVRFTAMEVVHEYLGAHD